MTGARPTRQERILLDTHYNTRSRDAKRIVVLLPGQLVKLAVISNLLTYNIRPIWTSLCGL